MLRYNHTLVERKWLKTIQEEKRAAGDCPRACTVLVPGHSPGVALENARLLVLTDFFASLAWGRRFVHCALGGEKGFLDSMASLGVAPTPASGEKEFQLAVVPRDFARLGRGLAFQKVVYSGRLLGGWDLDLLHTDFGGDALRLYFLFQGPPERDYTFNWFGLVSAHRFVQRVWRLAHSLEGSANLVSGALEELAAVVRSRSGQAKPHTALAAIMGYLKYKTALSPWEVRAVAALLQPFAPFLSAELTSLVAPVQNDHHGQGDQADG